MTLEYYSFIVGGGYTQWSGYTQCSTSCGPGKQRRTRSCADPTPAYGGEDCSRLGDAVETRMCTVKECPSKKFIINYSLQCALFSLFW